MPYDDDNLYTHRGGHWKILPRWVKLATIAIGLPAWLVFIGSIFLGKIGSTYQTTAFVIFAAIAVLQGFFIFRSYWKMEL